MFNNELEKKIQSDIEETEMIPHYKAWEKYQ